MCAAGLLAESAPAATLKADYQFQGTRTSSLAGAPALTDIGPGTNAFATETVEGRPRQVLTFPKANGLSLSGIRSIVSATSYSIVIDARLAEISGYRRLVDFSNGASDLGLYDFGGVLRFYNFAFGTPELIRANTYARIVLTRDARGRIAGYVDGRLAFPPTDDSQQGAAVIGLDILRFFQDDGSVTGEDSAGAVARIRLYDGALTADEVLGLSPPTVGRVVNVREVRGSVLVAVPAGSARVAQSVPGLKGVRFVPITEARQIPVGSLLDTRKGTVRLTSARDSKGNTQNGDFTAGVFQILQSRAAKARGLTELRLKGSSFRNCTRRAKRATTSTAGPNAQTAARRRRLSRRTVRRLRSNARGRFRTRGRYSSATVRGTTWTTTDRCDGTLTKVTRGRVTVRDLRRRKNITLRTGKSYLAKARR